MRIVMGKKIRQRLTTASGRRELAREVHERIQQQRFKVLVNDKHSVKKKSINES